MYSSRRRWQVSRFEELFSSIQLFGLEFKLEARTRPAEPIIVSSLTVEKSPPHVLDGMMRRMKYNLSVSIPPRGLPSR